MYRMSGLSGNTTSLMEQCTRVLLVLCCFLAHVSCLPYLLRFRKFFSRVSCNADNAVTPSSVLESTHVHIFPFVSYVHDLFTISNKEGRRLEIIGKTHHVANGHSPTRECDERIGHIY